MFISWWIIVGIVIYLLLALREYNMINRQMWFYRQRYFQSHHDFMIWLTANEEILKESVNGRRMLKELQNLSICTTQRFEE